MRKAFVFILRWKQTETSAIQTQLGLDLSGEGVLLGG